MTLREPRAAERSFTFMSLQHLAQSLTRTTLKVVIVLLLAGCVRSIPPLNLDTLPKTEFEMDDVAFELPGRGWIQGTLGDEGLHVTRVYREHSTQAVAVWPVPVPSALRGLTPREHAERYFDAERRAPRHPMLWEGFNEGSRRIGHTAYPVMTVRLTDPDDARRGDGLFLLYFPSDFETRQLFYVLLWVDLHPTGTRGRGLAAFDAMVPTFRLKPLDHHTREARRAPSS